MLPPTSRRPVLLLGLLLPLLPSCRDDDKSSLPDSVVESGPVESAPADTAPGERFRALVVKVTLDGEPAEGALVTQPGAEGQWTTGVDGTVEIQVDFGVKGLVAVTAAHPDARIGGGELGFDAGEAAAVVGSGAPLEIALERFATDDNTAFEFQDPGDPDNRETTNQCGHCHITINSDWYGSAHRSAASNPTVQDLYAGAAAAWADEETCSAQGGRWMTGIGPGTGSEGARCYVGDGALQALNGDCGETESCDSTASELGNCASCHAPGIDGELSGRGLLEATGFAYSYGIHCDVCHHVESVDIDDPTPGVAGRLHVLRPIEDSPSPVLGDWAPLLFGPYPDVTNPKMGSVYRDLFHEAELCGGCHLLDQPPQELGSSLDADRWPDGTLPIQSTYTEWEEGPYGAGAPCQSCHMPPEADTGNSADLGNIIHAPNPDSASGWYRPTGAVRRHTWTGPRSADSPMLRLAAQLSLESTWEATDDGDQLVVQATVKNVGAGHALPTGEPLRSMILLVDVRCDGAQVPAVGGDVVPDTGGALLRKVAGEDWSTWPGAEVGDVVRVVRRTGAWRDYEGFGPFGDGRFEAEDKGLPVEEAVGQARVVAMDGDVATFDTALPDGDIAYLGEGDALPEDGDPVSAVAGAAGFAWERVLVDARGARGAPSFTAVDVASDDRLLPQQSWTSEHRYQPGCADPEVRAGLYYRPLPLGLARERGWEAADTLMTEAGP